jgi:hypothetical protein
MQSRVGTHRSGAQCPRDALFKGRSIQEFSVGGTLVGDTSTLHTVLHNLSQHKVNLSQNVGTHRSRAHHPREASSKGHIVQGTCRPRDASSTGRIIHGTQCPRDKKSHTEFSGTHCSGIHRSVTGSMKPFQQLYLKLSSFC